MKEHDDYKRLKTSEHLEPCPCCASDAQLWQYSTSEAAPTEKVVMCSNGERFGPQDGIHGEGCPLYMPNQLHYRATIRDAIKYWNAFAKDLTAQQRRRRWERAKVLRAATTPPEQRHGSNP